MNINLIGIDLAKRVFQLCALSATNKVIFNRQVSRARLAETLAQIPPCLVAMEACASAHYWGRRFQAMGHEVRLIPAQHVKAFVRVNKNDANDALAICEAVQRKRSNKTVIDAPDPDRIATDRQRRFAARLWA